MRLIFAQFLLAGLVPSVCHATSILALRTDTALFVAVDSKVVALNGPETRLACKIFVAHNYVFAGAGLLRETHGPFDLQKIAEGAISDGRDFSNVLTIYENRTLENLPFALKFLLNAVPDLYAKSLRGKTAVQSIFGTAEKNVVRLAYRGFVPSDPEAIRVVRNDCPGTCGNEFMLAELGENSAIDQELDRNPQIWKQMGIANALKKLIEDQAAATPRSVAPPVAIIELSLDGTIRWLSTGVCDAQPQ